MKTSEECRVEPQTLEELRAAYYELLDDGGVDQLRGFNPSIVGASWCWIPLSPDALRAFVDQHIERLRLAQAGIPLPAADMVLGRIFCAMLERRINYRAIQTKLKSYAIPAV